MIIVAIPQTMQEIEFRHQNIFVAGCIDENKMAIYFHMHTNINLKFSYFGKSFSSMMLATKISYIEILFFYKEIYGNGINLYTKQINKL